MSVIESQLNVHGEEFAGNAEFMAEYVAKVRGIEQKQLENELAYRERARDKGKLLPRERLARLLDPGAPFVELCSIAGYQMYDDRDGGRSGGTLIAGIGFVSGRRCIVIVWNYTLKGGTVNAVTVKKMLRIQEIAFQTRLPVVSLHESGGGDLGGSRAAMDPWAATIFVEGGRTFGQQAELSARGIPQITVAHGNATAGGAYQVALSDYVVLVRGKTQLFLAGPPLLRAGTGEIAEAEELGGAEMHATISGTGEYLAEDDADGVRVARDIIAHLPADPDIEVGAVSAPRYSPDELLGVVPVDKKKPYRVQEIIARIADGSRFLEFSKDIDAATVCGHITLGGKRCAVVGNNGPITPRGATKVAQFMALCDQSFTPVIFLHNTTGFLVGVAVEQSGQVKHSAKMIQAVANLRAPKISILVGNSYGAGNYAMASRALKPDFILAWPTARQAVMGGAQAAKVMTIVTEGKWKSKGIEADDAMRKKLQGRAMMIEQGLEILSESIFCSSRLMDDGIIDPRDTRRVLSFLLEVCLEAPKRSLRSTSFGVPRY